MKHYNYLYKIGSICTLFTLILFQLSPVLYATPAAHAAGHPGAANANSAPSNRLLDLNSPSMSLGNLVWRDANNNGVQDDGEDGLANVAVNLLQSDGTPALDAASNPISALTNANGHYLFTDLAEGDYIVELAASNFVPGGPYAGYISSTGMQGSASGPYEPAPDPKLDELDSQDNGTQQPDGAIRADVITLTADQEPSSELETGGNTLPDPAPDLNSNLLVDFGLHASSSIGDRVWLDQNADGIQEESEPGVPGVTVQLYQPGPDGIAGNLDDLLIATMATGSDGSYRFIDLPEGDYYVQFTPPPGYELSPQDQGDDDTVDSDAAPADGQAAPLHLNPGENDRTWDAGICITSIGDRVWLDRNTNGIQDSGEPGLPGVSVSLYTGAGALVGAPVLTDADGNYTFSNLSPGDYYVQITPPPGYKFSPPDQGTDDQADSDIDPSTEQTVVTTIAHNESDLSWDIGLYPLVSVGDFIWNDANNNGLVDEDEAGIDGVRVNLFRESDVTQEMSTSEFVALHTKSVGGRYRFNNLQPGTYTVELDATNFAPGGPLDGYQSSTGRMGTNISPGGPYEPAPGPDNDINDDDNGTAQYGVIASGPITLVVGDEPLVGGNTDPNHNPTVDFGLLKPITLGSTVWDDANGNGTMGPGEPGMPDVLITLYDAADSVITTTTTDADGYFQFYALLSGSYQLGVSNFPAGYSFTLPNRGDDATDSDVDPTTGRTPLIVLGPGDQPTLFAGLTQVPLALTLASFSASHEGGAMVIRWTTGLEQNTFSFLLYRSATGSRADAVQITSSPILALGRGGSGAGYSWVDNLTQPGISYTYWLAEIELNGTTTEYGPARAPGPASTAFTLYLPLMDH
jgi:hypothetical protein